MRVRDAAEEAARLAAAHYDSGANCAESVLYAVPVALGDDALRLPVAAGMGWTAGIGRGGCLCGALSAAVALGGMAAEEEGGLPGARRERAVTRADEMREAFTERFGATCCRVLRNGLEIDTPECKAHCRQVTAETAAMTVRLLTAGSPAVPAATPRDILAIGLGAAGWAAVAALAVLAVPGIASARSAGMPLAAALVAAVAIAASIGGWRASRRH